MKLQVSERGRAMPASPIRRLMPLADAARKRGVRVLHLNIGQPDLETPAPMRRRLADAPAVLAYSPSAGTAGVRRHAAPVLPPARARAGADEILATTGGSEAILFALRRVRQRRATRRWWSSRSTRTTSRSRRWPACASCRSRARGEDGFHLPPREAWERALTPRTRLVLLCNPNNPTGTVYTPGRGRGDRRVLPRPRALPGRRRGLPRVRLRRRARPRASSAFAGTRSRPSSSTACRSATARAASGSAASRPATARSTARRCAWPRAGCRRPASPSSSRSARRSSAPTT